MNLLITGAFKYSNEQINDLKALGYRVFYIQDERIPLAEQNIKFNIEKIDVIVCNSLFIHNDIKKFINLKFIHLTSAGMDRIPIDYIKKHNIEVFNARGVYSIPMAEWVILKILELYKQSYYFYNNKHNKKWLKRRDLLELNGKTATIIGFGSVGVEVAIRLKAFGVNIIVVDRKELNAENVKYINKSYKSEDMKIAIKGSDIVILTLPLNEKTKHLINKDVFEIMNNKILINISRGGVICEKELIKFLENGKILGVALDVFEEEPLDGSSKLWNFENVIITPHNSFISDQTNERLFKKIYKALSQYAFKSQDVVAE